jgi:flagellar hook protein FlgE
MNLDARQQPKAVPLPAFDATNAATYNHQTSTTVYDSLGEPHILSMYFRRTDPVTDNDWEAYAVLDDNTAAAFGPVTLDFDLNGNPSVPVPPATTSMPPLVMPKATLDGLLGNGAQFTTDVSINFSDRAGTKTPTQYSSKFEPDSNDSDGTTVGRLTSVDIDAAGKVVASYSNGDQTYLAQVAMVKFANPQGLTQAGNTSWRQSLLSGEALAGEANSGTFGAINSSALEASNVNLTNELVDLIAAQRNFQANSRALEVNSTLQNTVLQIR